MASVTSGHNGVVYLVDDDQGVLRVLCELVGTIGIEARVFSSAEEFLAAYRPLPCECLICDVRMPGIDGLELQKRLLAIDAVLPVIFLTGYAEVGAAVEAMKRGALDFLQKPFGAQELLSKVKQALERSRSQYTAMLQQQTIRARNALLTPKEREIVDLVVAGKSSREIADAMGISIRTVENHRAKILDKLHVQSTVELVKLFL